MAESVTKIDEPLNDEYLTYSETLSFIPSIKHISLSKSKMQVKYLQNIQNQNEIF